jgi:hypothetical protein
MSMSMSMSMSLILESRADGRCMITMRHSGTYRPCADLIDKAPWRYFFLWGTLPRRLELLNCTGRKTHGRRRRTFQLASSLSVTHLHSMTLFTGSIDPLHAQFHFGALRSCRSIAFTNQFIPQSTICPQPTLLSHGNPRPTIVATRPRSRGVSGCDDISPKQK